jgi:ElaB/YqjD/DUF883 family membrane-anchored ribosome-binding protein
MDHRDIEEDVRQIVETRTAISQKVAVLKHRVQETVHDSKASVDDLVTHVRQAAEGFVVRTQHEVNPLPYLRAHPWGMMSGAMVVGFVIGRVASQMAHAPGAPSDARRMPSSASRPAPATRARWTQSTVWQKVRETIRGNIEQLKDAAIEQGHHVIDDLLQRARTGRQNPTSDRRHPRPPATSEVSQERAHSSQPDPSLQATR